MAIKTKHYWSNRIHPKTGKQYAPKALVLHITDGSFASTKNWIENPYSYVSYNWIIDKQGNVHRCVPEQHASWANGHVVRPKFQHFEVERNQIVNPNLYTISVAVENSGEVPPFKQWQAWVKLCDEILRRNNWSITPERVVNHYEIKSSKSCPRPYFTRFYLKLLSDIIL